MDMLLSPRASERLRPPAPWLPSSLFPFRAKTLGQAGSSAAPPTTLHLHPAHTARARVSRDLPAALSSSFSANSQPYPRHHPAASSSAGGTRLPVAALPPLRLLTSSPSPGSHRFLVCNSAGFTKLSVVVRGEEGTQLLRRKALDARLLGIPGPCGHCPTSPHPHSLQRTL
uniref:Uncharacterized protein n=1 Tax=Mustela putorius furo TaxID=9669 RepID=M3YC30_MUSPF